MKVIFFIFIAALVIYVIYFVVTAPDLFKLPSIPAYLSPFPNPSSSPSSSGGVATPSPASPPRAPTVTPAPPYVPPPPPPPQGFTQKDLSPFYGKVRLSSVTRPSFSYGGGDFTIRADYSLTDSVDVTGWRAKGNKYEVQLEGAVPGGEGPVNQSSLTLRPGEELTAYGATSNYVATIRNIHLNKCTGYLNDWYHLNPQVPQDCPRPVQGDFGTFSSACQNYLYSLRTCEVPSPTKVNELAYDVNCRAFLDALSYQSCYQRHVSDTDFLRNGWRVWFTTSLQFDSDHDRILLLDRQGLLVDQYLY